MHSSLDLGYRLGVQPRCDPTIRLALDRDQPVVEGERAEGGIWLRPKAPDSPFGRLVATSCFFPWPRTAPQGPQGVFTSQWCTLASLCLSPRTPCSHQAQERAQESWVPHKFRAARTLRDSRVSREDSDLCKVTHRGRGLGSGSLASKLTLILRGQSPSAWGWLLVPGGVTIGLTPQGLASAPYSNLPW